MLLLAIMHWGAYNNSWLELMYKAMHFTRLVTKFASVLETKEVKEAKEDGKNKTLTL